MTTSAPSLRLMLALQAAAAAAAQTAPDNCSSSDAAHDAVLFASQDVMFSGLSLIIPGGLILNVLSLVVFMSRPMRRRASSWYLAALAASDSLSLVSVSFDYWLKDDRIGLQVLSLSLSPQICQLRKGGYVFISACVCLIICLLA